MPIKRNFNPENVIGSHPAFFLRLGLFIFLFPILLIFLAPDREARAVCAPKDPCPSAERKPRIPSRKKFRIPLYRAVYGATRTAEDVEARLKQIREALRETPAAEKQLGAVADSLEQRNRETLRALRSDVEIAGRSEPVPLSINDRLSLVMEGERFSLQKPTQTHIDSYNIAAAEFADQLAKLHGLVEVDLIKLEKDMEAAGAPWTPGRVPDWPGN